MQIKKEQKIKTKTEKKRKRSMKIMMEKRSEKINNRKADTGNNKIREEEQKNRKTLNNRE